MLTPEILGRALGEAPDPELARVTLSRMEERPGARALLERPEIIAGAARLLGFSTAASDFFTAHPEELEALSDLRPRTLEELEVEAGSAAKDLGDRAGLRRFRRRASYRVAARDLMGAAPEEVMAELTWAAEACLRLAAQSTPGAKRLAVIGLGKLGGQELNYSSDVDVVFVHGATGAEAQEAAGRAAASLIAMLSEPTSEGMALRVDASLRPDGRAGPLSRSLESMEEYYSKLAATWERQAMVKARPVAGDAELGAAFVDAITPFVYPSILPASAIEDVRSSKARIEEFVRASGKEGVELKRGRGGIRDIEFAVQLLQLVHGRRHPRLREPNTLSALDGLAEEGYVSRVDADTLSDSYRFLRTLEHRLQMVRDLQTHELPVDRRALGPLARSMGLASAEHVQIEYGRHTDTVRTLHERLFYRPLLGAFASAAAPPPGADRPATEELLAGLGFGDPAAAYDILAGIFDPSSRLGRVLGTLFPVIAPPLAFAATPDTALVRFGRVVESLHALSGRVADTLADRPDAMRRLAALVAVSSSFADALVARPALVRALLELPVAAPPLFPGDPQGELVRVAGAYASGELTFPDSGRRLSGVADGILSSAVEEEDPAVPMAVIGLGRLGSEELSFASDLDVVFVYEGEGPGDFEAAGRAAEHILARVGEEGWLADADLRPEGRAGPLARSMASYLEYWQRWAETWEFQALLRARWVAGDEQLGRRFLSNAADFAYPETLTFEQVAAIRRMRVRMEEERVRPAEARRFHFKLGYGSLADVQWAVELSLMRHGNSTPELRTTNTLEALEALTAGRFLEESVAASLGEAYVFLSDVKNALEIERRVPIAALPPVPEAQAALARRLGYAEQARHRFLQDYRRITRKARLAMERVFYEDDQRGQVRR